MQRPETAPAGAGGMKLGYSAIHWHEPDLERCLAELAAAGWQGWECRLPLDWLGSPARVRRICAAAGMPLAVYTACGNPEDRSWSNTEANRRRIEFAAEMEADCFMFMTGPKPSGRAVTAADLRAAAEAADAWAEYGAACGIELSYHIHTNTLVDSIADWRAYMGLLERARLCIDVSHAQLWGADPVAALREFAPRLNYVHLQDYRSAPRDPDGTWQPVWCDVGAAAAVDFGAVMAALAELDFRRWVTACPRRGDAPLAEAQRSRAARAYLRRLGY